MQKIDRSSVFLNILFVTLVFFIGLIVLPASSLIQSLDQVENASAVTATSTLPILHIDISNTPALQQQGLSGRTSLAPDSGMWFVFATPAPVAMWMKDMNFALDMVWVGSDMKIQYIQKDALPSSYPNAFYPQVQTAYVLEVNAGYADAHGLQVGDVLTDKIKLVANQ